MRIFLAAVRNHFGRAEIKAGSLCPLKQWSALHSIHVLNQYERANHSWFRFTDDHWLGAKCLTLMPSQPADGCRHASHSYSNVPGSGLDGLISARLERINRDLTRLQNAIRLVSSSSHPRRVSRSARTASSLFRGLVAPDRARAVQFPCRPLRAWRAPSRSAGQS